MALAIRDAKRLGSQLVLATDPDCDRVGLGSEHRKEITGFYPATRQEFCCLTMWPGGAGSQEPCRPDRFP